MVHMNAEEASRDLHYELNLLRRMETVTVDGAPLGDVPYRGKYSYWHRFVQFVFSSDIRRFSASRSFEEYKKGEGGKSRALSLKGFLVALLGLLVSFAAWGIALMRKPSVLLFGIDRVSDPQYKADFRTRSLHAFLKEEKIPYVECLHTVFNASFLKNLFARGKLVFYLESLDTLFGLLRLAGVASKREDPALSGLDGFSDEERRFVSYVVKKYLGERALVEFRVKMLTRLLKDTGTRAVWLIDDARYYHDIALAARAANIPSYAFQHGHFTPYHAGWLKEPKTALEYARPDYLVVWSGYWKKELVRLGGVFPEDALIVGGYPNAAPLLPESRTKTLTILVPHETDSPKGAVRAFLMALLDAVPEAAIVMKLRPDYPKKEQIRLYGNLSSHPRVRYITRLSELDSKPALVLGVYSSFLYDMVRAEVPVAVMDTPMDYGKGMVLNGLADAISLEGISEELARITATSPQALNARSEKLGSAVSFHDTLGAIARSCGIGATKKVG